jgi:hypothetical protein
MPAPSLPVVQVRAHYGRNLQVVYALAQHAREHGQARAAGAPSQLHRNFAGCFEGKFFGVVAHCVQLLLLMMMMIMMIVSLLCARARCGRCSKGNHASLTAIVVG